MKGVLLLRLFCEMFQHAHYCRCYVPGIFHDLKLNSDRFEDVFIAVLLVIFCNNSFFHSGNILFLFIDDYF